MSEPFLGQITLMPYNFAPYQWMMCQGQLLPIRQFTALFSLLGTTYGGNGTTTFALPDLRARVPMGSGTSTTGTTYSLGEFDGTPAVTLTTQTIPPHSHSFNASTQKASSVPALAAGTLGESNAPGVPPHPASPAQNFAATGTGTPGTVTALAPAALTPFGGGNQPHNNVQPILALNWCIAMAGVFPSRQ